MAVREKVFIPNEIYFITLRLMWWIFKRGAKRGARVPFRRLWRRERRVPFRRLWRREII